MGMPTISPMPDQSILLCHWPFYHFIILYKSSWTFVDYILYVCGKKTINEIIKNIMILSIKTLIIITLSMATAVSGSVIFNWRGSKSCLV